MGKINIILDPAHGKNVAGKRSPDEKHFEYLWSRERCKSLEEKLKSKGYKVFWTSTSENEEGLLVRQARANNIASENGASLLISLHNDAFGNGWTDIRGYSVYTSKGKTKSDSFAELLMTNFGKDFPELKQRVSTPTQLSKEENFTVLMGTKYSAVLIEWLFQNNKEDVKLLSDSEYNNRFENCIVKTIEEWKQA